MKTTLARSLAVLLLPAVAAQAQPALSVLPKSKQAEYEQPAAQQGVPLPDSASATPAPIIPSAPLIAAKSYILMDYANGAIVAEHNADERLPPASLTKLMTSYVLSYEIEQGHVRPSDVVTIGKDAWSQNPIFKGSSLMFIRPGQQITLRDLDKGIIVDSGNDAATAVADYLAGSEQAFVDVMNQHAKMLGMTNTHYMNPHGLPEDGHYSTARDIAILSRAIINYPNEYALYKVQHFTFNGIRQTNRNGLLFRDPTVDGLKTGHTEAAGYCLAASAVRQGMRLISVVMGADSWAGRERESEKLLSWGFRYFETRPVYKANTELSKVRIWGGEKDQVPVGVSSDVTLTIPRGRGDQLKAAMSVDKYIHAPIVTGQKVGDVVLTLDGKELARTPLIALQTVHQGGIFTRFWDWLVLLVTQLLHH